MFFHYLWKKKWLVLLYIVIFTSATLLSTLLNLAIPGVFEAANVGKYKEVIISFGLMFVGIIFARLLEYYADLAGIHFVNRIRRDIKRDLFAAVLHKQLPDYADRNAGEYIAEFTNDITMIEKKFYEPFKETISYIITCVTVGAAIFTIDYRMVLVIVGGFLVCLLTPVAMTPYTASRMLRFLQRFDNFVQYLKDLFGAFFTFKNYSVEKNVVAKFSEANKEVEELKYNAELSVVLMDALVGRLAWTIEIAVFLLGLVSVIRGKMTFGEVFAAYLLAGNLGRPLQSLGGRISSMRSVNGLEKKFQALGVLDPKISEEQGRPDQTEPFDIKIDHVSLTLKENQVLKDVSLTFEHGKKYLILGNNGSGKSTVAKLLKNNYRHYTGMVQVGAFDIKTPDGVRLSRNISYSNETVSLFADTVRNNILLYRNVKEDSVEKAVEMAELNVDLDRLVGDGGRFLSSGERRKLEIARSLIESPNVLIFDEVVSTLDIETAYEIEKMVLSFEDRTVIMISNAFSGKLLEQYDRIILMGGGCVLAQGTHKEMMEQSEQYRQMYHIRCGNGCQEGSVCS